MRKNQRILEDLGRNSSTQIDIWNTVRCFILLFEQTLGFFFRINRIAITISFDKVHDTRNFNLQNVNVVARLGKFLDHVIDLVCLDLDIFTTLVVIDVCIVRHEFKEERHVFCNAFIPDAFNECLLARMVPLYFFR